MTSYFTITIGQREQFDRMLAQAGLTAEDVASILKDPQLAASMVAALRTPQDAPFWQPPSWYVSPEKQLARMHELSGRWGWLLTEADFAAVSTIPQPRLVDREVLMLAATLPKKGGRGRQSHLERTLTELWAAVEAPEGYRKRTYWDPVGAAVKLAPGYMLPQPGLRWVVFAPNAHSGRSPRSLWEEGASNLATVETLSALLMFPEWPMAWGTGDYKFPNLAALQCGPDWSISPYLYRWGAGREFRLYSGWAGYDGSGWASPAVREC